MYEFWVKEFGAEHVVKRGLYTYPLKPRINLEQTSLFDQFGNMPKAQTSEVMQKELDKLPKEIVNSITFVDDVPDGVLDSKDVFFAMKDVLAAKGITDPLLVNWLGINKHLIDHPKLIESEQSLRTLLQSKYKKKLDKKQYETVFKLNKLAEVSFDNWVNALKNRAII